jgi:hypothetical protein
MLRLRGFALWHRANWYLSNKLHDKTSQNPVIPKIVRILFFSDFKLDTLHFFLTVRVLFSFASRVTKLRNEMLKTGK